MDLISILSNGFSIGSGTLTVIQTAQAGKKNIDEKLLKKLTAGIDYDSIDSDLQIYAEAADDYIQKHQNQEVGIKLLSSSDRDEFVSGFYSSHPDMTIYRYYIDPILNSYLNKLEKRLQAVLSTGEKFIAAKLGAEASKISQRVDMVNDKVVEVNDKIDRLEQLLTEAKEEQKTLLKNYFDDFEHRFEDKPDEDKQGLIGDLSLLESFIDITINPSKNVRDVSAVDFIETWADCEKHETRVKVLYGEPGHGKTTIGYKLVYDYINGEINRKTFYFPLVSSTYSIASPNDTINILDALRLDKFSADSILSRDLIENSLIILDGYDELQVALGNKSKFSTLPTFYDFLGDFAKQYNCIILLTTRSASINMIDAGMKHVKKSCMEMNPMTDNQQDEWILKHHPSYMEKFNIQRGRFSSIEELSGNILGIPFVFILMVNAEFDDTAGNLVELYDKLFEATFIRKGVYEKEKLKVEHSNYELLASKIYEQGDKRALISSLDDGIRLNIFAYSYYLTINKEHEDLTIHDGYYEFYHRTFYEYFLAWDLYNRFLSAKDDIEDFLNFLASGVLSDYIQKYLGQIVLNSGHGSDYYKDNVDRVLDYISKTDAIIISADGTRNIDRCATVFVNTITLIRLFTDRLLIHNTIAERFSDYEDTTLCRLIRSYRCQKINLSNALMVGAHLDHADLRRALILNADISGKSYLSFSSLMYADFSGSNMEGADLSHADADYAVFRSVNLQSSRLEDASFVKASFIDADLRGANLHRANLTKAVLTDVKVDGRTSFLSAEFDGLQTNVDLSIAIPEFRGLVENGTIRISVSWKVIYEEVNPRGSYTQLIKWIPPKATGYIVQFISVDDPLKVVPNYDKPYYEAWRVNDGVIEDELQEGYDDSFSNEGRGMFRIDATDEVQRKLKEADIQGSHIKYRCMVYWVFDGSDGARAIENWSRDTVSMAGKLPASYDEPPKLGFGKERLFSMKFRTVEG